MIELKSTQIERAILVAVRTPDISKEKVEEHLDELELLAETAGADTIFKILQDRARVDSAFFIGKGKVEEIGQLIETNDINLVIFDDDLTATQVRNLEKLLSRKIVDRSGLILDIFASHAKTNEAKTQVELAQLQYMLPRLTRAWTHLSKQYGGIGTKGPGETQIETDRRLVRTRISKLKEKLIEIDARQQTKSSNRKNFIKASIVGYTNAGKSTLINLLTNADVLAENKLFATLDSTTRALDLDKNKQVLISDTVGFIRKLPHNLVASFKSTLNVVRDADVILHVIDCTHPFFEDHIKVVEDTLNELDALKKVQVKIFNKVDAIEHHEMLDYIKNKYPDAILISAMKGMNIGKLKDYLLEVYEENFAEHDLELNFNQSKIVSQIHTLTDVTSISYDEDKIRIRFRTSSKNLSMIKKMISNNVN